jgi:hypothetical protein
MSNSKKLNVIADRFEEKLVSEAKKGEYGGKGTFELPKNHKAAMQVTKGGSCCKNCKYVDVDKHACKNKYYIKWNGGDGKLPDLPLDEICSDWWQPK